MVSIVKNLIFPFTAIVGQEKVKKALILNAINPSIGGVLIRGDKGTGKTTAVRALADLLPSIKTVKGCPFNCNPDDKESLCQLCKSKDNIEIEEKKMRVVELPLGSTEDRVVGSLDIKKALKEGIKALEPGILAEANRNILYVDEINLLDDHLVDVLLDAAAYGINYVEREGISISHPSRFILVGTMNPAEGELRPQLADRIGLHINVETIQDIKERVKIMARREEFEEDPEAFRKKFQEKQEKLLKRILNARKLLAKVKIDERLLELIARICVNVGVDGHRADIAILKASKTIAAYNGRTRVLPEDLEEAVELVLGERIPERSYARQDVKRQIQKAKTEMGQESSEAAEGEATGGENPPPDEKGYGGESRQPSLGSADLKMTPNPSERTIQEEEVDIDLKSILKFKGKKNRRLYGSRVESKTEKGKYVKSKMLKGKSKDIAIDATLRAAALKSEDHIRVEPEDLREKIRKHGARASIALVVDISGSMFTDQKAAKIKNILNKIIQDAQRHKDKLSVIGFKGRKAEIIIPTTKRAQSFQQKVDNIRVGGTTPMAHGIKKGLEILKEEKKKEEYVPVMLILSDGMPNVGIEGRPIQDVMELGRELNKNEIHTVVINFERKFQQGRNINMELAMLSGGRYYDLDQLEDPSLAIPKIMDYERNQF